MWAVYKHAFANLDEYQVLCWNCNYIKRVEGNENSNKEYVALVKTLSRERMVKPVRWARDFDACTACNTVDARHHSKGLCMNCYQAQRRRQQLAGHDRLIARGVIDGNYPADKEHFDALRAEFATETVTL